jgi:flavin-binding protein dodecin
MTETSAYRGEAKRKQAVSTSGVCKVIELYAESPTSWEQAVQLCVAEAVRTVKNITSLDVDSLRVSVRDDSIQSYQARCKVTFAIDDAMRSH